MTSGRAAEAQPVSRGSTRTEVARDRHQPRPLTKRHSSMFVFDDAMGPLWWTNETLYLFIYAFDPPADNAGTDIGSEWLFYFAGSNSPRSFGVVTGPSAGPDLFFGP